LRRFGSTRARTGLIAELVTNGSDDPVLVLPLVIVAVVAAWPETPAILLVLTGVALALIPGLPMLELSPWAGSALELKHLPRGAVISGPCSMSGPAPSVRGYGDAFIDDYERRRRDLLKRIELMDLPQTGKSELGRWITTTADSLEQAKADLAEIVRLLEEAKAKVRSGD
jgi:hypothetical protein